MRKLILLVNTIQGLAHNPYVPEASTARLPPLSQSQTPNQIEFFNGDVSSLYDLRGSLSVSANYASLHPSFPWRQSLSEPCCSGLRQ